MGKGSRGISLLHSSGRSNAPSDVQQAVSRSGRDRLGSQVHGSTTSLSILSEPPDARNWFSSYEYESPVLGTIDGFKDSVFVEIEGFLTKESTKEKENHVCKSKLNSEITDSLCLPSQVSEPPDIRNWFSSYAYESFVLDTYDDVRDSVCHKTECERGRGSLVGDIQKEQGNVSLYGEIKDCKEADIKHDGSLGDAKPDDKSSIEVMQMLDSSAVFTEPPDVRKWFSSYAYESPVLSTSDRFEDSLQLEMEPKEEFVVEDSDGEKEENFIIIRKLTSRDENVDDEKMRLNVLAEENSSIRVHNQEKVSKSIDRTGVKKSPSPRNNICSVVIFKDKLEGSRTMCNNDMTASQDAKGLRDDDEGPIPKLAHVFSRKQNHRSSGKENNGKGNTENGFVATKKNVGKQTENEDSRKRPQGVSLGCSRNKRNVSPVGEKDAFVRTKALMEATNYQNSNVLEVTGKWRCPQKGKPILGPPLKQLRLEQWVHRL